ncbi:unnamed protein product [Boreogadus saida]
MSVWDCLSVSPRSFRGCVFVLWSVFSTVWSFNIQADRPAVYRGPGGSYFGYSVDFYQATAESNTMSVLVGAPKANTSQPGIVEAGAVYYCPWPGGADSCRQIPFDNANNRMIKVNGSREPLEFKSHQWFGASVRTHKGKVVACAPLYHWRTVKLSGERDPVGTCYVAVQNFSAYAEYSPCRTNLIVGAFGVGEISVYRARAVVSVDAWMVLTPKILNADDRQCVLPDTDFMVTCLKVKVCAAVSGVGIPDSVDLTVELQLDWLKGTRGGAKRVLSWITSSISAPHFSSWDHHHPHKCFTYTVYLKAYMLLDCGEDNLCIPGPPALRQQ